MPAISRAVNIITRTIQARETPYFTSPPPFPPFRQPDDTDDGDGVPFRLDPDDLHADDDNSLSGGTIAAIVVSVVVFFVILTGLLAYLTYRRRKARKIEIALKEESVSDTAATVSGALDPPPPYDEVHLDTRHPGEQRWDSRSDVSGISEEEDSDAMGSHATVTDGLAPERHSGSGVS
ncbi:hypothetical protein C8A01DRAFT_20173 [Parachaetomium inaequale]|uniref:Uncharacterized protein n=1 Tax=Parachaetomium inaequale TaxID=2588326 RepID=A0AAN6SM84_9PEZI|nr:hypothetical protein C8A01DRAFT_20173 [Parachaetomium inaequale]